MEDQSRLNDCQLLEYVTVSGDTFYWRIAFFSTESQSPRES
jgi:hypothetical protein